MLYIETLLPLLKRADIGIITYFSMTGDIPFNPEYGVTFQRLREQRNYKREDFNNFTERAVQYFEEGRSGISFDRLDALLQDMNVLPKDFANLLYEGEKDYFIEIYDKIERAYYDEDNQTLVEIYQNKYKSVYVDHRIIALSAKALYGRLNDDEIEEVSDFFMAVEHWTTFEQSAVCLVSELELSLVRSLTKDFFKTSDLLANEHAYRKNLYNQE